MEWVSEPDRGAGIAVLEAGAGAVEEAVLRHLRESGPQTFEQLLAALQDVTWSPLFLAVDRMSRTGLVSLHPAGDRHYRVSANL